MIRKIIQPFYTAYVIVTFVITILIAFPFFALLSVGRDAAARRGVHRAIRVWTVAWLWLIGMPVRTLGKRPAGERYIIVANHISYMDTLVIFPAIKGYFRPLGKKEVGKIPVVGFIYKQVVIMVDRSSAASRAKSLRLLWRVVKHEGSIIIFPEGTFNETPAVLKDFYDGAFRLAINTHTPILPVILPDTAHRWHYSGWWKLWPGKNRAIFLDPIPVDGLTMDKLPQLKAQVFAVMEAELGKYERP